MKSEVLELSRVYCRYLQAVKVLQVLRSVLQAVKSVCRYYIFFIVKHFGSTSVGLHVL